MLIVIAGFLALFTWFYLVFFRGGFWQVKKLIPSNSTAADIQQKIAVIIPARNEAAVVSESVASLLQQSCADALHIFLVDDGSTDNTAEVARRAAAQAQRPSQLTIVEGQPLPLGWSGKLWAMQQGIERAQDSRPDLLLFTDADIRHSTESISTLVSVAEAHNCDLASCMVRLHCTTLPERLLIPAFVFFFLKLYPPAWIVNPRRKTAGAAGGCVLIRPKTLQRVGGIQAIRNQVIDDCALAMQVKSHGGRVWLGLTGLAESIRPYESFSEIGRMISRTAFNQLRHSVLMLSVAVIGLIVTYLAPPLLLLTGRVLPMALGGAAWLLMIIAYMPMIRFYGLNPLWSLLLPLVAIFYMGAAMHSAVRFWSGRGGEWKGRVQDPRAPSKIVNSDHL